MSLRDQLVAKGLVSNKRKRDVERQLKKDRKRKQGNKRKQREVQAEAQARQAAEDAARRDAAAQAKAVSAAEREAHEHTHRVRQIVLGNRLGGRGRVRFFHRVGDTGRIRRMELKEPMVRDLRMGRSAIVGFFDDAGEPVAHVVPRKAAEKLVDVEPAAIWHWVRDGGALQDPAEAPLRVDWEPSVRPHRVASEAP